MPQPPAKVAAAATVAVASVDAQAGASAAQVPSGQGSLRPWLVRVQILH
jgi:hypothetical protein